MNGCWLMLYDGSGRRLGQAWWYETQAEAELEAQQAFQDSEKVREAVIWRKRDEFAQGDWYWVKAKEIRRGETGCCIHTRINGGLEAALTHLAQEEGL